MGPFPIQLITELVAPLPCFVNMENLLLLLPKRPQTIWVRYGVSATIVFVFFIFRVALERNVGQYGFFLLLPSVFLASVLFDRGSGFFATILSLVLLAVFLEPDLRLDFVETHSIPFILFGLVCIGVAAISEALRNALERAVAAETAKDLLLRELGHRVKNNLFIVQSVLQIHANSLADGLGRQALNDALARVRVISEAHAFLDVHSGHRTIKMDDYLTELVSRLGDALRGLRPIAVDVWADQIEMPAERAVPVGLIVNELVTNAFKHAFPGESSGTITVKLERAGTNRLVLTVADDGQGCEDAPATGLGQRLTNLLARQLQGSIERSPTSKGCEVIAKFAPN